MAVVGHIVRLGEEQAGPGRFRRAADEEAVAADVQKDRALSPASDPPAGRLQGRQHQRAIQRAVQAKDLVRREPAGQQRVDHGSLVAQHSGVAGVGCGDEDGEQVG